MSASTSPIPYTGNKSCIVDTILDFMPPHDVYIEPCMGSAEVFFQKKPAEREILNDFNGDLVNLFRVLQNNQNLATLLGRVYLSINAELLFQRNKELLKQTPNILDDLTETAEILKAASWKEIQSAVAFFENQVYSYSSTGNHFGIMRRDITHRLPRLFAACCRLRDASILHRDYKAAIEYGACENCFILLDPPYKGTESYYPKADFDSNEHTVLFDFMGEIDKQFDGQCIFLITYNNDPFIRDMAEKKGFDTYMQPRKDNMRQGSNPGSVYEELMIANYDLMGQAESNHKLSRFQQVEQLGLFDFFNYDYTTIPSSDR